MVVRKGMAVQDRVQECKKERKGVRRGGGVRQGSIKCKKKRMHAKESESMWKSWCEVARKCVMLQEIVELRERALGHKKMSMHEEKQAHSIKCT